MKQRQVAALLLFAMPAMATVLFDNGQYSLNPPNGGNFLDCSNCRSAAGVRIYEDFVISGNTWLVDGLFGRWEILTGTPVYPTSATWEIRSGVGQANDGTLLASGVALLSNSVLGSGSGVVYFEGNISIPTINLAPGTYWMNIAPTIIPDETYLLGTNGVSGVNALIDGTSFVKGTYWPQMQNVGAYLQPFTSQSTYDFSYGVKGQIATASGVPEPATWMLMAGALVCLMVRRRIA